MEMKKLVNYILVTAAAFAALSCNKEVAPVTPATPEGVIVFKATLDQPAKASLDAYKVVWEEGDVIAVKSGDTWANSTPITEADIEDGGRTASFSVSIASASSYTLVYPASAVSNTALPDGSPAEAVMLSLPAEQVIPAGGVVDPAALVQIGTSTESNKVTFKNAVSLVEILIAESGIDAMYVQAINPSGAELKIGGEAAVTPDPGAATGNKSTIKVSGSFTSGQKYIVAVWPQTSVGSVHLGFSKGSGSSLQKAGRTGTSAAGFDLPVSGGRVFENLGSLNWFDGTIKTKADLDKWASLADFYSASETVKLGADIDYQGDTWTPVSGNENSGHFAGTFDGAGHCIYNIALGATGEYAGFFSILASPDARIRVKDLILGKASGDESSLIVSSGNVKYAGALSTRIKNTQISNVKNYIPVTVENAAEANNIGGLVGQCMSDSDNSITNCHNYANVSFKSNVAGNNYYGGIVGLISGKTAITDCTNSGVISRSIASSNKGVNCLGGIAGRSGNTLSGVTITNCTNSGTIEITDNIKAGQLYMGGIIGMDGSPADASARNLIVSKCTNSADVNLFNHSQSDYPSAGGIIGRLSNDSLISECTNLGVITKVGNCANEACLGGISGYVSGEDGLIDKCINGKKGDATAGTVQNIVQTSNKNLRMGGIIGYAQRGTCTNSTNYGPVTSFASPAKTYAGGIAGNASISNFSSCSNYGKIDVVSETPANTHSAGGLIGLQNNNSSEIQVATGENCFVAAAVSCSYAASAGTIIGRYSNTTITSCWGSSAKPIIVSSNCTVNNVAVTSSNFGSCLAGSDYGITASGVVSTNGLNTIWAVFQ